MVGEFINMSEVINMKFIQRINGIYKISDNLIDVMNDNPGKAFYRIIIDVNLNSFDLQYVIKVLNNSFECVCDNYENAIFINELINQGLLKVNRIILRDDLEMKDRSYIDFKQFKNTKLVIPIGYYMWGVKNIDDEKSSTIDQKSIDKITGIVQMISEFPEKLTDIEKIILLVNYVQQNCEYIQHKVDVLNRTGEKFELIDDLGDNREVIRKLCHDGYGQVGSNVNEPLFENYGICSGFATLMELLLNNPYIRIKAESVSGEGHSWNVVLIGDKYYNLDVTRSITYSPYRAKHNLRTLKFNKQYILVGTDFLEIDDHEKRTTELGRPYEESREDFNHEYIDAAIEHLRSTGLVQFEYGNESFYHRESSPIKK